MDITSPPQQLYGAPATLCDPKRLAIADGLSQEHRGSIIIAFSTANAGADDGNWAADTEKPARRMSVCAAQP
jgi:hypothetical protein